MRKLQNASLAATTALHHYSIMRLLMCHRRVVSFCNPKQRPYTKTFLFLFSASFSTGTKIPIHLMSTTTTTPTESTSDCGVIGTADHVFSKSVWDGSDTIGFNSLNHIGYSTESNPENFTGGWHAHRKVWEETDDQEGDAPKPSEDWTKEIIGDITKFDYESMEIGRPPRILVLYGSLRPTSFSRKAAYEFARLLGKLCTVSAHGRWFFGMTF